MSTVKEIIKEVVDKYILQETAGVNNKMLEVADLISDDIIEKYAFSIYKEYKAMEEDEDTNDEEEDDWYDNESVWDDIEICDGISYNGNYYRYNIFYDDSSRRIQKGSLDNDVPELNYLTIKKILDAFYANNGKEDENYIYYVKSKIKGVIFPIIEHELTHSLDDSGQDTQGTWLTKFPGRYVSEDEIRECLYMFSDNEMNARIGSVGSLMTVTIRDLLDFGDDSELEETLHSSEAFNEIVHDLIYEDEDARKELNIDIMQSYLNKMAHYNNFQFRTRPDYLKYSNGSPMSLAYYLFRNDTRLKKNRKIKYLFDTNFDGGEKAVYNFYNRLYQEYIRRIYKACYGVLSNYIDKKKAQSEK